MFIPDIRLRQIVKNIIYTVSNPIARLTPINFAFHNPQALTYNQSVTWQSIVAFLSLLPSVRNDLLIDTPRKKQCLIYDVRRCSPLSPSVTFCGRISATPIRQWS